MKMLTALIVALMLVPGVALGADWDDTWTGDVSTLPGARPSVSPGERAYIQIASLDTGLSPMLRIEGLASICLDGSLGAVPASAYTVQVEVLIPTKPGSPDEDQAARLGLLQSPSPCVHAVPSGPVFLRIKATPDAAASVVVQGY